MPDIVHVACKLPSGLQIDGVHIGGCAFEPGAGAAPPARPGGYAITSNVLAGSWNAWAAANAASPMITRNLIFADPDLAALKAKAQSLAHVRSGLEPR